jgi:hypothetical protein
VAVALGLRVKLGWALAVFVDVSGPEPIVVARGEARLDPAGGIFPFHAAMQAEPADRDEVIAEASARALDAATDALADLLEETPLPEGVDVVEVVGVVVGRGVRRIPVDRILASSQLLHTAEAEVIQVGFVESCVRLGLPVVRVPFADLESSPVWPLVDGLAAQAGRPWRKDHKHAATAAWLAWSRRPSPSS